MIFGQNISVAGGLGVNESYLKEAPSILKEITTRGVLLPEPRRNKSGDLIISISQEMRDR